MKLHLSPQIKINPEKKIERTFHIKNSNQTKSLWVNIGTNRPSEVEFDLISGIFKPNEQMQVTVHWKAWQKLEEIPILRIYFKENENLKFNDYLVLKLLNIKDFEKIKDYYSIGNNLEDVNESSFLRSQGDLLVKRKGTHIKYYTKKDNLLKNQV